MLGSLDIMLSGETRNSVGMARLAEPVGRVSDQDAYIVFYYASSSDFKALRASKE